jgi:anaerobic nitric oxide reductase transcription regulator
LLHNELQNRLSFEQRLRVIDRTTKMSNRQQPDRLEILLEIARDLTASLASEDRYQRLLEAVQRLIPADASCLLRLEGDELVPLAAHGLTEEALVRRYPRGEHPRLDIILSGGGPVRFPPDSPLPDPFDGMLASDPGALDHIHACMGCPLTEGGEVVGALTTDALAPDAFDHIEPRWLEMLGALAGAAVRTTTLIEELQRRAAHQGEVARALQRHAEADHVIGNSPAARQLLRDVELVAASDLPVLVHGETGVGKEIVAQQLHARSARSDAALIQVNCAALPESIAESELFGHVRGAFTGAQSDRAGKFEVADGATLVLDEIGELPLSLQPKLLRALQQGEIQRIGDDRVHRVDVRVIASTNRDLEDEVRAGRFRADLYHRLAVYPLRVPPLRERRDDVPVLAAHFLDRARRNLGLGPVRLSPEAREALVAAPWPGNVRELENVISRAALRAAAGSRDRAAILVDVEHLGLEPDGGPTTETVSQEARDTQASLDLRARTDAFQRREIERAVFRNGGNWAAAARDLGMHRSNLHRLASRLGLRGGNGA